MSSEEPNEKPLNYQTPIPTISESRRMAARISMWVGGFTILGGSCEGVTILDFIWTEMARVGVSGASPWDIWFQAGLFGGIALLVLAAGTTYLVGGVYIRRGNRKWVKVIFALSICHEVLFGLGLLSALASLESEPRVLIGLFIYLLYGAALWQLILKLNETRKEVV